MINSNESILDFECYMLLMYQSILVDIANTVSACCYKISLVERLENWQEVAWHFFHTVATEFQERIFHRYMLNAV